MLGIKSQSSLRQANTSPRHRLSHISFQFESNNRSTCEVVK